MDDALALLLYRAAATGAKAITGAGGNHALATTLALVGEIAGALALGILAGLMLYLILKFVRAEDKILEFSIASLLLVVGISMIYGIDPILPSMTLGITIANLMPRRSETTFALVEKFAPPIWISFFVLAGAHIEFGRLTLPVIIMIVVYVLCRTAGKVIGAYSGAKWSGAPPAVQKYLGLCLQSQAGVAVGLAILAGHQFAAQFGKLIIMVVMTATFLTEIFGPMLVKVGVKQAGEVGMNVTEEELIKTYKVSDVYDDKPTMIKQDCMLKEILDTFCTSDSLFYPVVDPAGLLVGIITISGIKETFANQEAAGWLLAYDVMEPVVDKTTPQTPLEEAFDKMNSFNLETICVVAGKNDDKLVGVLDVRTVNRRISAEILRRRQQADGGF